MLVAMSSQALRADAERNRRQLVDAARVVYAERGLDAPLDEIARRAGVGNATLYRRFPTRCQLIAAVFADTLREVVDATGRALADPDPWQGFTGHLTFLCQLQAGNRALADLLTATLSGADELEQLRGRALRGLTRLIDRAKASGDLRADFGHQDVVLLLMANAGLIERTADAAPAAWRRHLSYVLAGLRSTAAPPGAAGPTAPAPSEEQVINAMNAVADRYGCG
jgi:AcrR family transcriptional regulator